MKSWQIGLILGAVFCGGCLSSYKKTDERQAAAANLPQLIRFSSVLQARRKPGTLFISGLGSAATDGGKTSFTKTTPLSSNPAIELTIQITDASALDTCLQRVQETKDNRESIDIRGTGSFTVQSVIDPPLNTGVFTLTTLDACGATVSPPAVSTAATPAADLVAVPERYLDHHAVITGRLTSAVHFMDPVSGFTLQSDGQYLAAYFPTSSLPAESRLSLVHAVPGSTLILEGTLTHVTPTSLATQSGSTGTSGYEFDVSAVVAIRS